MAALMKAVLCPYLHFCRVLYREAGSESACAVLAQLLGRRLFFVTVQCAIMVLAAAGLTLLTVEQVSNIVRNTVRNSFVCPVAYHGYVALKLLSCSCTTINYNNATIH